MKGRQWWLVVVVLVVVMLGLVGGDDLRCDVQCTCEWEMAQEKDYNVRCNATMLEEATVTEQLLPNINSTSYDAASYRTYVQVQGTANLTLTFSIDFLLRWRMFPSCSLDVIGAGHVIFPRAVPSFVPDSPGGHYFAGVGLANVTVEEMPFGVFSGKHAAGFHLSNSTVARLPGQLLTGATSLAYLEILSSQVGVLEGPLGDAALHSLPRAGVRSKPVRIANSTIGIMRRGAVRLRAGQYQKIIFEGLSLGLMESGAVEVEGAREVVVEKCTGARMEVDALLLGKDTHLTFTNNWFVLQPGALTNFPCEAKGHYIQDNLFTVLHNATASPVTLTPQKGRDEDAPTAEWERQAAILGTAIQSSCITANFPPPPTLPPSPSPLPSLAPHSWLAITPEQVAAFCAVGLIIGVVVTCLIALVFLRIRRRRNVPHANPTPTIVMSHLPTDPIYDEPYALEPPPLPATLRRPTQCSLSSCTPEKDACCGREQQQQHSAVENEYMTMDRL